MFPPLRGSELIKRLCDESGYSMVEVLAAIVILSLAILPMISMFDAGLRAASTSGNYDQARALANAELEKLKAMELSEVESSEANCPEDDSFNCDQVRVDAVGVSLEGSGNSRTFDEADEDDSADMMRVTVTVSWGSDKSYSATGIVSR